MADKRYVFLSYGRKDVYPKGTTNTVEQEQHFSVVEKVYWHLHDLRDLLGSEPWFDKLCLTKDRPFTDSINHAIEQSDYMLLFIGKHSMGSEWCEREWKHALRNCVPVIPILLEGGWGDADIQAIYPAHILSTDGINPQRGDGRLDEDHLRTKIVNAIQQKPAPLAIPYNAGRLPDYYIERPQYLDDLKKRLGVNDHDYKQRTNIVGITSRQEIAALQGIGGIGKTTLALALCNDCEVRRAFDYIFWLEAGAQATADDATRLMRTIGTQFGDAPDLYTDAQTGRGLMQKHLNGKRSLVVLDDVWADGLVKQFSLAGVDCRLVVTTRNKSLVENPQAVEKLSAEEGLRLLASLFNSNNPDIDRLNDDHNAIVMLLDGYTLAIKIAGKWLNKYKQKSAAYYLKRLRSSESDLFKNLEMSKTDKNANLELSLSLSYNDLDAADQKRFRALGMFAPNSNFPLAALDAIWETEDGFVEAQQLIDVGLLDAVKGAAGDDRYSQHTLLRAYARALLSGEETEELFQRFADFYIQVAEQFNQLAPEQWGILDDDLTNIQAVGDELVRQISTGRRGELLEQMLAFVQNTITYVYWHRDLRGSKWLEMGANAARVFQGFSLLRNHYLKLEGMILNELGLIWNYYGGKYKALEYFDRAISAYSKAKNRHLKAITLNNIGQIWSDLGDKNNALEFFDQAMSIHLKAGAKVENRHEKATVLSNIGGIWSDLGNKQQALNFYEKALLIDREIKDKEGEGTTLNNIGGIWFELKVFEKALNYYEQAFVLACDANDKSGQIYALNNIATLYGSGEMPLALELLEQALIIGKETISADIRLLLYENISYVYRNLGRLDEAISKLKEVISFMKLHHLPNTEGGRTLEEYEAVLWDWEQEKKKK